MATVGSHLNVVEKYNVQVGAGNGETLKTKNNGKGYGVVYYNPVASRTGVILEAGVENGQMVRVVNTASGAYSITFATAATSNVALGTAAVIGQNLQMQFTWSVALGKWVSAGGTAVIGTNAVTTSTINAGAVTSAKIDPTIVQAVEVDLTATEIVGTSAGDIGHTAGAVLVAAAPTGYINQFLSATLSYTFATAAYTGGGDDVVIRQGTTAVTGVITSANMLGAASSKVVQLFPLSTSGTVITKESSLNLFATTAWTQPGTAAGTLKVYVLYRVVPV